MGKTKRSQNSTKGSTKTTRSAANVPLAGKLNGTPAVPPRGDSQDLEGWTGDSRVVLPMLAAESIQCCVTSPPYWGLRDYDHPAQIGAEESPEQYVQNLVEIFREVRRVLRKDGTFWLRTHPEISYRIGVDL